MSRSHGAGLSDGGLYTRGEVRVGGKIKRVDTVPWGALT
jgi:hypothetical protein